MEMRLDEKADARSGGLDTAQIAGAWLNTDRGASGGTLRLEVTDEGEGLRVRGFGVGADGGSPIEWGETDGIALAQGPDGDTAWAFTCTFDHGFSTTEVAAYGKEGILIAASYMTFTDGSGRADYWTREFFHRDR
jgi:hypothetical protein